MKNYLIERWKRRWIVVPAAGGLGIFSAYRSSKTHDGRALKSVLLFACFVVIVILFPFHFGGEDWNQVSDTQPRKD
jgi:cytochrome bd-type quinol oxidase subunit 1